MAGWLSCAPHMIEAFYHEALGVILVQNARVEVEGGACSPTPVGEPWYLRVPGETRVDPEYLEDVAQHLQEHWIDGDKPTFSAN